MRRLALPLLLVGCLPTQISGASAPTEHTFKLLDSDIAYIEADVCAQDWVTGNVASDLVIANEMLDDRGVEIQPRRIDGLQATALATRLKVPKDFYQRDEADQASLLTHELVHYCQRAAQGDIPFVEGYFASPGRWRTEVPAYTQTYRTMRLQGVSIPVIEEKIEARVLSLRNSSWLWDIEPTMYVEETRRLLRRALAE